MSEAILNMIDIRSPEFGVEVHIDESGKRLWVNVDGICKLRIYDIQTLTVIDEREERDDT